MSRRSTRRKSRRGGAKYGKMPDNSSRRRTMSKFVRKTPTEAPGAAMALLAQHADAAREREDAEFRRQMRGMPRFMVGHNLPNEPGPARSAPGSPLVLPDQNPQRDRLPAIAINGPDLRPNMYDANGHVRSAPPSPRRGGRSRKSRRRHK